MAFNAGVMLGEGGGEWKGRWDVMEASGGETTSGFWFWWCGKEETFDFGQTKGRWWVLLYQRVKWACGCWASKRKRPKGVGGLWCLGLYLLRIRMV